MVDEDFLVEGIQEFVLHRFTVLLLGRPRIRVKIKGVIVNILSRVIFYTVKWLSTTHKWFGLQEFGLQSDGLVVVKT